MGKNIVGKKPKRSVRWLKLFCICLGLFMLWQIGSQYQRHQYMLVEVARQEALLQAAQQNYADLQNQLELLFNDSYLEQLARRNLGMVRAGEIIVMQAEVGDIPELNPHLNAADVNY